MWDADQIYLTIGGLKVKPPSCVGWAAIPRDEPLRNNDYWWRGRWPIPHTIDSNEFHSPGYRVGYADGRTLNRIGDCADWTIYRSIVPLPEEDADEEDGEDEDDNQEAPKTPFQAGYTSNPHFAAEAPLP